MESSRVATTARLTWFVALAVAGCSDSPYELAPVQGRVTIEGQPLAHAKLMFSPVDAADNLNPGKPAFGLVQEDGSYSLTTFHPNDGAVVGEHWVTIVNLKQDSSRIEPESNRDRLQFSKLAVPRTVTVVAGQTNRIDLSLTAEDVSRFGVLVRD
jgi:hypothetical protein